MRDDKLLTVGELAKELSVSVRRLQYYDKEGLLPPTSISEGGRRLYSAKDAVKLYQILSMKSLGFSLKEIKRMLLTLDTPAQVAELLKKQGALVTRRIAELQEVSSLISRLHDEVFQIDKVDFEKYADILRVLKAGNEFYWASKLLDDKLKEHTEQRFADRPELALDILDRYKSVLEEAVTLVENNEPPQSKRSMTLAKKWWDMVEQYTGGDMSLLPNLMKFNDDKSAWQEEMAEKQKLIDPYIGEALIHYFSQSGISVPEMEETT